MTEQEQVEALLKEGYDRVYIWKEGPHETDEDHSHEFDTHLLILEGELTVTTTLGSVVARKGDVIDIVRHKMHRAVTGDEGCTYVVAEKH